MKNLLFSLLLLSLTGFMQLKAQNYDPSTYKFDEVKLSTEEQNLYELITKYRVEYGLPPIPISRSLTYVAQIHCWDLHTNKPETDKCNMHSWSSAGTWTECCYPNDHTNIDCMIGKPYEITDYKGYGFEIVFRSLVQEEIAQQALDYWKNSPGHNEVIINSEQWRDNNWEAIGIGIYEGVVTVWFGELTDEAGIN